MSTDSLSPRCGSKALAAAWSQSVLQESNRSLETRHSQNENGRPKSEPQVRDWEIERTGHSKRGLSSKSKAEFLRELEPLHTQEHLPSFLFGEALCWGQAEPLGLDEEKEARGKEGNCHQVLNL